MRLYQHFHPGQQCSHSEEVQIAEHPVDKELLPSSTMRRKRPYSSKNKKELWQHKKIKASDNMLYEAPTCIPMESLTKSGRYGDSMWATCQRRSVWHDSNSSKSTNSYCKKFTSHIPCYIVTPLVKRIPLLACDQNANHFLKHKVCAAYVSSTWVSSSWVTTSESKCGLIGLLATDAFVYNYIFNCNQSI